MVKMENPNLAFPSLPPGFELPPGFDSLPPQIHTCAAAESSRNRNPTPEENEPQSPDSSTEQEPRRTHRKRARPEFYQPEIIRRTAATEVQPEAPPRGRGRPAKAPTMPLFSLQEAQRRDDNEVASTSLARVQLTMNQPSSQASQINTSSPVDPAGITINFPIVKTKARSTMVRSKSLKLIQDTEETEPIISRPLAVRQSVSVGCQTSEDTETIISRHLANARQTINWSETSEEYKSIVSTLTAIVKKHGDITKNSSLECDKMKALMFIGICNVVRGLQNKQLVDLDIDSLDSDYRTVRDAGNMKVDVQWLREWVDDIQDAVLLSRKVKGMENEKRKRVAVIDGKRGEVLLRRQELERIKSEIEDMEKQIAQEVIMVDELDKEYSRHMSRLSGLQQLNLMDKLV